MKIAAILIVALVASAGCGGSDDDTSGAGPAAPEPAAVTKIETGAPLITEGLGGEEGESGLPDVSKLDELPPPSGVSGAGACASAGLAPTGRNLRRVQSVVLCLHNAERRSRGLRPLRMNRKLARAALSHSRAMVRRRFFAHDAPGGGNVVSRVRSARYIPRAGRWTVGENLAFGSGPLGTPGQIMGAWMDSPGHKANVLTRRFKEIGVGIVMGSPTGGGGGATYTTVFGAVTR